MTLASGPLIVDRAHCGPPDSANGGWLAGLLAQRMTVTDDKPAITVRLTSPPPLETEMKVVAYGSTWLLQHGSTQVATASPAPALDVEVPAPATVEQARAAAAHYEGLADHPFPTCFSCGTQRDPADALALRPGRLSDGSGRYAAIFTAGESSLPLTWSALDCPGGWAAGIAGRPMVLGSMTAQVRALPVEGSECVVTAWRLGGEGRKHLSASMLHDAQGALLAVATAVWIAVDPDSVRPVS